MMQKSTTKMEPTNIETEQLSELLQTAKTIDQIRKGGIDQEARDKIASEKAELERIEKESRERLPGKFLSLKNDGEERNFLFTGAFQKVQVPMKDWGDKKAVEGKTTTRFRFQVYDTTNPDSPSEVAIWERGATEAKMVFRQLEKGVSELTIVRNGAYKSPQTSYSIYPCHR
jgi:hypothetical protein